MLDQGRDKYLRVAIIGEYGVLAVSRGRHAIRLQVHVNQFAEQPWETGLHSLR